MKEGTRNLTRKQGSRERREALRREFYERVAANGIPLADAIRGIRLMLGKTQREYAEYTGVPPRTVMAIEQGRGNPTLKTMEKLLRGTGLEIRVGRKSNTRQGRTSEERG